MSIDTVNFKDREVDNDFGEQAACKSLNIYAGAVTSERADLVSHAERTVGLLKSFAGSRVPPEAFSAAMLHDVVDRFINTKSTKYTPEKTTAAQDALMEFFTNPELDYEQGRYISCLLADMVHIEVESGRHRVEMAKYARNGEGGTVSPEVVEMMSDHYQGAIPADVWQKTEPLLDFERMRSFLSEVNIEALLIKASELLDNMQNPSSKRKSALFQDVLEAESFYAPIIEVIGFEGLASALRSEAHLIRLRGQGQQEAIEKSTEVVDAVSGAGTQQLVRRILGGGQADCATMPVVEKDSLGKNYPIHFGEFAVETVDGAVISGNYRLKGRGSLANKIAKNNGDLPMDVLGLMVISEDETESAKRFADFIEHRTGSFRLNPSNGRLTPVFIDGSNEYVAAVLGELESRQIPPQMYEAKAESNQQAEERRGYQKYQVSKVTFFAEQNSVDIPVEVQFLTKEERRRSRLGETAHIVYKYLRQFFPSDTEIENLPDGERCSVRQQKLAVVLGAKGILEEIYDRVRYLSADSLEVNQRSIERGDSLIEKTITTKQNAILE